MADSKISDLAAVTDLLGTDAYVLARSGASKKITGQSLAAGIIPAPSSSAPGSPVDGQLWLYPVDAAKGLNWLFRYNAGSSSSHKWEYISGPPSVVESTTSYSTPQTWYPDPILTIPLAGDYYLSYWGEGSASTNSTGFNMQWDWQLGDGTSIYGSGWSTGFGVSNSISGTKEATFAFLPRLKTGLAASALVKIKPVVAGWDMTGSAFRAIAMLPARVG
jgi:hypothetical protein